MPTPELEVAVRSYAALVAGVRARVLQFIRLVWLGMPDYRDADIERFVNVVVPVVTGGQQQTATLTDAYLSNVARVVLGEPTPPAAASQLGSLRGVAPADLYRRPFVTMRTALSNGHPFPGAVEQGLTRALSLASTDLQLAKTHTARRSFTNDKRVVGHRRVLTGNESCGLCVVASTQRYHRKNLMPIHPGCDCTVMPIYSRRDPGRIIEPKRLEQVNAQLAERFGPANGRTASDYRNLVVEHTHGEIGPVLAVRGHHFTSAADL